MGDSKMMSDADRFQRDNALLEAAHFARVEEVCALAAAGANPNRRIHLRVENPQPRQDAGGSTTAMLEAAASGSRDCVIALLQAGGRMDLANNATNSPLHRAVLTGDEDFAVWMARLPQSLQVAPQIETGELLALACMHDMPKLLKTVLDLGYVKAGDGELLSRAGSEAVLARNRRCLEVVVAHAKHTGSLELLDLTKAFFQSGGDPKLEFMRWMLDHTNVAEHLRRDADHSPVVKLLTFDRPREARMLVEQGYFAKPNADTLAQRIEDAVRSGQLGAVQLLTEWGADQHPSIGVDALLKIAKREDMRRLLRSVQAQRIMQEAMSDAGIVPGAARSSDPGPI